MIIDINVTVAALGTECSKYVPIRPTVNVVVDSDRLWLLSYPYKYV